MFHNQLPKTSSSILSPSAGALLCAEVTHQANGKARYVPPKVQVALDRLQLLETGEPRNVGSLEHQLLLGNLREYRDALKEIETRYFPSYRDLHRYQECLFSFIESPRKLGDFHDLCEKSDFPTSMATLLQEIFRRNADRFLIEIQDGLKIGAIHPHLPIFLKKVGSPPLSDPHIAGSLLDTLTKLYVKHALDDTGLILKIMQQNHASPSSVRTALENLISYDPIECHNVRSHFLAFGRLVADAIENRSIHDAPLLRSHPVVELGFLMRTIRRLSLGPRTAHSHPALCKLCEMVPEYFVYLDGYHLREVITSLQVSVGGALNFCDAARGKELVSAARVILQQHWGNETSTLWNLCTDSNPATQILRNLSAQVLKHALTSEENLKELKERVYTLAHRRDRKSLQQLKHVGRLMGMVLESDNELPEGSPHARNAVDLLGESCTAAKVALPALMRVLGIPGVTIGYLGFIPFPWKRSQHPDKRVRSKTREILLGLAELIGPFALRRVEGA